MLLELLKDFLKVKHCPSPLMFAKNFFKNLELKYKQIHTCPHYGMIYWNETKDRRDYKFCKAPRNKQFVGASISYSSETSLNSNKGV